jgi:hypothetical protein
MKISTVVFSASLVFSALSVQAQDLNLPEVPGDTGDPALTLPETGDVQNFLFLAAPFAGFAAILAAAAGGSDGSTTSTTSTTD